MTVRIYHNPRCSKSRGTLALLEERAIEPEVIRYLEQPPIVVANGKAAIGRPPEAVLALL